MQKEGYEPKRRTLALTDEQRSELLTCRDPHKLPYMRERAAALLFIAAGSAPAVVAREKLWHSRDPDTLYSWLDRYQEHGLGFTAHPRAADGASPLLSPLYQTADEAKGALTHLIRRDPRQLEVEQTRWNLPSLRSFTHDLPLERERPVAFARPPGHPVTPGTSPYP